MIDRNNTGTKKNITLIDVAKKANVSPATVSRVLNKPELVNAETLLRVRNTIDESGFLVNEMARGLRLKKSGVILVIAPSISVSSLFSQQMSTMKKKANEEGFIMLMTNYENDVLLHKQLFSYIYQYRADGILFFGGDELLQIENIPSQIPPIVAVNERFNKTQIPSVSVDGYSASQNIIRHLIGLGHRNIGHIAGPYERVSSAADRLNGFLEGMKGLEDPWIYTTEYNIESGAEAAYHWILLPQKPSAVYCSCDEVAFGFISELYRNGFEVPKDVSIVGFDDIPLSKYCIPPLTTIRQPHEHMSELAIKMLSDLIHGRNEEISNAALNGELIVRQSTHKYIPKSS